MNRPGVSLIEVLFAIGVIAVGLLGVTAVLPVALHQIGHGNVADRAYRVGQDAIHDIHVREMNNYNNWVWLNRNTFATANYQNNQPRIEIVGRPPDVSWFSSSTEKFPIDKYRGYAIDPMFLATNGFAISPAGASYEFPYDTTPGGSARMERVSLVATTGVPAPPSSTPTYSNGAGVYPNFPNYLNRPAAELIFLHDDDLTMDIPEDKSLPPEQQYPTSTRREFNGHFSWIATFAPTLDASDSPRDTYSLSIVVLHRRDLSMAMDGVNERVVGVSSFASGGFSGGDVTLTGDTAEELELRTGNWVMLMGSLPTASSGSVMGVFRWYRVIETEKEPRDVSGSGKAWLFERDVTLQGADWPTALASSSGSTQAMIMQNVVAVYERTVEVSDLIVTQ